ncbi:MAG: hypothetical protein JOZ07_07520 [Solirubrobacterales bacterium]|nr:hypothetical protein [Solirubrobacterales bacterium]
MSTESLLTTRIGSIDLTVVDRMAALLLTAGALVDAGALSRSGLSVVAIVALVALTGSVAFRRQSPIIAALTAASGLAVFQLASGYAGDGLCEEAAIALCFYLLGCRARGRERVVAAAGVLACLLTVSAVAGISASGGAVINTLFWFMCGALPFVVGRTLATSRALTHELEQVAAQLQDEQTVRARRAVVEERSRMARELHDVIAHCVSVMVVQTSGAQRAASWDLEAARKALRVAEVSGREALVELRRIVGALQSGEGDLGGATAPGVAQLHVLADRARGAGLPVDFAVVGEPISLPPALDLVVYRVVQEALTNAIKHAGPARARVLLTFGAGQLDVEVSDSGRGSTRDQGGGRGEGSGHGLLGMNDRLRLYGGDLAAGPRASGGFEVRARIPLNGDVSAPEQLSPPNGAPRMRARTTCRIALRWLDRLLAGVFLVVLEIAALTSGQRGGALLLTVLIVAVMALACIWRRRSPLAFLIVVVVLVFPLSGGPLAPSSSIWIAIYVGLIAPYAVAAWGERRNALLGLAIIICAPAIGDLILNHRGIGSYGGAVLAIGAAWSAGRAVRARRTLNSGLERTSARLAAERHDREQLAVAAERTRIARELHAIVADGVSAMVVQTEAARGLLGCDSAAADTAMYEVVSVGRQALSELRRILGVLRHRDDAGELEPQPGVDQIYELIQRARERGQQIELTVDGEPGTLPAGVDLGIYRIVEDALNSARQQPATAIGVTVHFGEDQLELQLTATCLQASGWPTNAMSERARLCGGELRIAQRDSDSWQLVASLPRDREGVLA